MYRTKIVAPCVMTAGHCCALVNTYMIDDEPSMPLYAACLQSSLKSELVLYSSQIIPVSTAVRSSRLIIIQEKRAYVEFKELDSTVTWGIR